MKSNEKQSGKHCAIILAGGSGKRMQGTVEDKVLTRLGKTPAIALPIKAFIESGKIQTLIFVCRDNAQEKKIRTCIKAIEIPAGTKTAFCRGGKERRDSVLNGLICASENGVPANSLAFIHDGARPLISPEKIRELAKVAMREGASVLAHRSVNTVKRVPAGTPLGTACKMENLERAQLWEMETPQVFPLGGIIRAYKKAVSENINLTDDVSAFSLLRGGKTAIVENTAPNPKITVPTDLLLIKQLLHMPKIA